MISLWEVQKQAAAWIWVLDPSLMTPGLAKVAIPGSAKEAGGLRNFQGSPLSGSPEMSSRLAALTKLCSVLSALLAR